MRDELEGEEYFTPLLTLSEQNKKRRGAPCRIEDGQLFSRRNHILGALEYHWAEVGWELQHAGTAEQVRAALKPIPNERQWGLEPFLDVEFMEATQQDYRDNLRALAGLEKAGRPAYEELQDAKDRLTRIENALQSNPTDARLLAQYTIRRQSFERASARQQEVNRRADELRTLLAKQSAYLAPNMLLTFIGCKRYKMDPTGFANAMAGLPEIDWRQSSARCAKNDPSHPYANIYELFQEVSRCLPEHANSATVAVEHAKSYLLRRDLQNRYSVKELRKQWYYLQLAIETAYASKLKRGEAPYRVFTEYMRRSHAPTAEDSIYVELEALT